MSTDLLFASDPPGRTLFKVFASCMGAVWFMPFVVASFQKRIVT